MSTRNPLYDFELALSDIPPSLRSRLIKIYSDLKRASLENEYDAVGTRAGKLAEVLLRVLQFLLTQAYTPLNKKLDNFKSECERLENTAKTAGPEGLRILSPRALSFLYTLRSKRDFGHAGGEVDLNKVDALTITSLADWCLCELIRVCHKIPIEDAQLLCNAIAERQLPKIWNILGRKRVLETSLGYRQQTLLLLYSEIATGIPTEDLFDWIEHSNRAKFRLGVLKRLHRERFIEWDRETEMAIISPTGIEEVERRIIPMIKE
jgi:hypothetical protein